MIKQYKILQSLVVILAIIGFYSISVYFTSDNSENALKSNFWVNAREIYVPNKLSFAEEDVPLNRIDVKEQLEREIIVNTFYHSQTILLLKNHDRFFKIIEPILAKNNIPDDFKYLAIAESGLSPTVVSPSGAVGLWQFMEGTAKDFNLEVNDEVDERYNIEKSTQAACDYLNKQYEYYKNWTLVAASYNTGKSNVDKQIGRQKSDYYYDMLWNEETRRYVYRILAMKIVINNPTTYGFYVDDKYPMIKTKIIEVSSEIPDWADFAHKRNITYKTLKDFNPWLRETFLTNKSKTNYQITIPIEKDKFVSKGI